MTTTATIIDLTHDQPIRLASWAQTFFARVFTVEGYARQYGDDPATYVERSIKFGHPLAASIAPSAALVAGEFGRQLHAERLATSASAVTLAEGALVRLEGRLYRTKVARGNDGWAPQNSDPFIFVPVEG